MKRTFEAEHVPIRRGHGRVGDGGDVDEHDRLVGNRAAYRDPPGGLDPRGRWRDDGRGQTGVEPEPGDDLFLVGQIGGKPVDDRVDLGLVALAGRTGPRPLDQLPGAHRRIRPNHATMAVRGSAAQTTMSAGTVSPDSSVTPTTRSCAQTTRATGAADMHACPLPVLSAPRTAVGRLPLPPTGRPGGAMCRNAYPRAPMPVPRGAGSSPQTAGPLAARADERLVGEVPPQDVDRASPVEAEQGCRPRPEPAQHFRRAGAASVRRRTRRATGSMVSR